MLRLMLQNITQKILKHRTMVPRELANKTRGVGMLLESKRGQAQASRPTLCAFNQRLHFSGFEGQLLRLTEKGCGLGRSKMQISRTQFQKGIPGPQLGK